MRIAEVMTAPVRTIPADAAATSAWEEMRLYRTRHLVATGRDGEVVGVISAGDLGGRRGQTLRADRRVADLMSERVISVTGHTTVREAANLMRGHQIDCLPVLEGRKLIGIVTSLDLLELIGRGAERPVAVATRAVLKHRGDRPKGQLVAKRTSHARQSDRK